MCRRFFLSEIRKAEVGLFSANITNVNCMVHWILSQFEKLPAYITLHVIKTFPTIVIKKQEIRLDQNNP